MSSANNNLLNNSNNINISNNGGYISKWESLKLNSNALDLKKTLFSGQSFVWKEFKENEIFNDNGNIDIKNNSINNKDNNINNINNNNIIYIGVINKYIVILKYKDNSNNDIIDFQFIDSNNLVNKEIKNQSEQDRVNILRDYFNLQHDINQLFSEWRADSIKDIKKLHPLNKQFRDADIKFTGLRLINQNPLDCLFSFICSQNNNIGRIKKMVNSLITSYGSKIGEINGQSYCQFPTLEQLSTIKESDLNEMGFGYRSKFIVQSCKQVIEKGGIEWLNNLRTMPYEESQKELTSLFGVGQKVADCISLFSLNKLHIVPIDTHIFKITKKHIPSLSNKSLSPKIYKDINQFWFNGFGNFAGWGHTILFANEISEFKDKDSNNNKNKNKNNKNKNLEIEKKEELSSDNNNNNESSIKVNKRQRINK